MEALGILLSASSKGKCWPSWDLASCLAVIVVTLYSEVVSLRFCSVIRLKEALLCSSESEVIVSALSIVSWTCLTFWATGYRWRRILAWVHRGAPDPPRSSHSRRLRSSSASVLLRWLWERCFITDWVVQLAVGWAVLRRLCWSAARVWTFSQRLRSSSAW